jgi:hypothetical protein
LDPFSCTCSCGKSCDGSCTSHYSGCSASDGLDCVASCCANEATPKCDELLQ